MGYDDNIYYHTPDGWAKIADEDWAGSWEFDILVIFQNQKTGELRVAFDSGCSCPTPFEDYADMWDTKPVASVNDVLAYAKENGITPQRDDTRWANIATAVHRALRDGVTA